MRYIFITIITILINLGSFAQTGFAPLGAKWTYKHYTQGHFGQGREGLKHNEVVSDSFSDGIRYVTIEERVYCQGIRYDQYAEEWQYSSRTSDTDHYKLKVTQDTVYFLNPIFERYTPLYVFNVNVGDTFRIPLTDTALYRTCEVPYGDLGLDVNTNSEGDSVIAFIVDSIVNKDYNGTILETYFISNPLDLQLDAWPYQPLAPQLNWLSHIYYETINFNSVIRVSGAYTPLFGGLASGITPTRYGDITMSDGIYTVFSPCSYSDNERTIYFSTDPTCDTFKVNAPLSLRSAILSNALKIYPNPAQDILHIDLKEPAKGLNIKIVNLLGSIVKSSTPVLQRNNSIDISDLNNGIYLLIIENNGERYYHKFVKQ